MKRAGRVLVGAAMVLALAAQPGAAAFAVQDDDRADLQQRLDAVVDVGAVGAVARVRSEDGLWRGTSGVARLGTAREVPVNGRFRAASITKTFLATVILQLVEEGRLGLEDPVERWLPGVVPEGDRITVRHLLNHTSGLYDYLRTLPFPPSQEFVDNRWRTWTPEELVERAVANAPTFRPPGSDFAYSNTGYTLLGRIVAEVTGRPYGTEIERRLLRPLRLNETWMPGTSPRIKGPHAHGYVPVESGDATRLVDLTEMNPSVMGAGGEIISSARDLDRFFAALLGGRLLPGHLLAEMKTSGVPGGHYGLGLAWRDTSCGIRVYGNDGDALTYLAYSFVSEDLTHRVTVALTPDFRRDTDAAADRLLEQAICG